MPKKSNVCKGKYCKKMTKKRKLDKNNNANLNKLLKKKHITEKDEEYINVFLKKQPSFKKEIINKVLKKMHGLKKKKQKITINKYLDLYDEYSFQDYGEKIKIKLDKGDYNIYVSNYIKNTSSMIIIEKNEPFRFDDVKFVKNKKHINISDSQRIIFEENNNKLYDFELQGQQFFGYKLPLYCGKINGKIKILLIPIINIIN